MFRLNDQQQIEFADAVNEAADRVDWAGPLAAIYESVADAIVIYQPNCDASGACCRFDEYGHALFVTTIELAAFVAAAGPDSTVGDQPCPHQIGGRCSVHASRPFGCRIFYCDPSSQAWQTELYARLHRELQRLHERLDVPYYYVEWRQAMGAIKKHAMQRVHR